ncbi:MAG: SCO family protein [Chloroflexi bacterium]|nr:SCO family protein [Chloroflexota bacterium]MCC6897158.1 SCO family protein [Anaerolineae bacterium]
MSDNSTPQSIPANNRLVLLGTLLVGIISTFVVLYALTNRPRNFGTPTVDLSQEYTGVQALTTPRTVKDFTLVDETNTPVSLSDFRGKMVLMFFGFTNCVDICPITMFQFKQVREKLGAKADEVAMLFISVDPQRDTPSVIADYMTRFDPAITGLVGDTEVFDHIKDDYGLEYVLLPKEGSETETEYSISHTPNPFLLDREGRLVASYAYGTTVDVVSEDISQRLGA